MSMLTLKRAESSHSIVGSGVEGFSSDGGGYEDCLVAISACECGRDGVGCVCARMTFGRCTGGESEIS